MKTILSYATGLFAILVVVVSTVSAVVYASTNVWETLRNLASSTLSGIGVAIGGCLGSALILRFKAAREFIKKLLGEVKP
jgi:hypothetical protein